jgi:hypothetical protein
MDGGAVGLGPLLHDVARLELGTFEDGIGV